MEDEIQVVVKEFNLKEELINKLSQYVSNVSKITDSIIHNSFVLDDANVEKSKIVRLERDGVGSGKSRKTKNVYFDLKKLFMEGSASVLTIVGASVHPLLIPIAAFVILNKISSLLEIEINEYHAGVLWVIWENVDKNNYVVDEIMLRLVNKFFKEHTKQNISQRYLNNILKDLEDYKCIKKINSSGWMLLEEIIVMN